MGSVRRLTEARLRTILARQDPPAFGRNYQPAIRAVREEAPAQSRFAMVWSSVVDREISTLSRPEKWVLYIVLYCPWLFDIQEQRMLPYLPAPHPLTGHPHARGMKLPSFRGTLAIAEELGALALHPVLHISSTDDPNVLEASPFPWIGDFLLFLLDDQGPFCINLSIKNTAEEFCVPSVGVKPNTDMKRAVRRAEIRHRTEQILYADIDIPTIQVAADKLNTTVLANLEQIYGWQRRAHPFDEAQRCEIVDALRAGVLAGVSALEVLHNMIATLGYTLYDLKVVMYQAIWNREIRINLYQHFFIEQPFLAEHQDVLDEFAHWFRRS